MCFFNDVGASNLIGKNSRIYVINECGKGKCNVKMFRQ
jgi:hypothetical protein